MLANNILTQLKAPSLLKLGACFIYEALVVIALSFICALPYLMLVGDASHGAKRYYFQLVLWLFIGAYFVWCWHKKGQTLAMQAWHFHVLTQDGSFLSMRMAMIRYLLATLSLMLLGFGFLWAIVDRENLFLHDRLLKNKLIFVLRKKAL